MSDPTGYFFATQYLERGWTEWKEYLDNPETGPMIGEWQTELLAKLSADSLARIIDAAKSDGKDSLGANKYLYDTFTTKEEKKNNVGRPTRERIQREAKALVEDEKIKEEAYRRVFHAKENQVFQEDEEDIKA